jgi:hypothetical protein
MNQVLSTSPHQGFRRPTRCLTVKSMVMHRLQIGPRGSSEPTSSSDRLRVRSIAGGISRMVASNTSKVVAKNTGKFPTDLRSWSQGIRDRVSVVQLPLSSAWPDSRPRRGARDFGLYWVWASKPFLQGHIMATVPTLTTTRGPRRGILDRQPANGNHHRSPAERGYL